jgi:hypothetical protein
VAPADVPAGKTLCPHATQNSLPLFDLFCAFTFIKNDKQANSNKKTFFILKLFIFGD